MRGTVTGRPVEYAFDVRNLRSTTLRAGSLGFVLLLSSLAAQEAFATLGATTDTYAAQPVTGPVTAERLLTDHDDVLNCGMDTPVASGGLVVTSAVWFRDDLDGRDRGESGANRT